jgi:hypothetical protein
VGDYVLTAEKLITGSTPVITTAMTGISFRAKAFSAISRPT